MMEDARDQAKGKAAEQAKIAEDKLEELLSQGGFYTALAEFLVDLPMIPYACMKGPTVRIKTQVKWTRDVAPWSGQPSMPPSPQTPPNPAISPDGGPPNAPDSQSQFQIPGTPGRAPGNPIPPNNPNSPSRRWWTCR